MSSTAAILPYDYAKASYRYRAHHLRFESRIANSRLVCQECGGAGGRTDPILDYGEGPWDECGFCEGTGKVTPYLRGLWLRYKQAERKGKVK